MALGQRRFAGAGFRAGGVHAATSTSSTIEPISIRIAAGTRSRSEEGVAFEGELVVTGSLGATVAGLDACVAGVGMSPASLTPVSVAGVEGAAG